MRSLLAMPVGHLPDWSAAGTFIAGLSDEHLESLAPECLGDSRQARRVLPIVVLRHSAPTMRSPPTSSRSTSATALPRSARSPVATSPAGSAPITITFEGVAHAIEPFPDQCLRHALATA